MLILKGKDKFKWVTGSVVLAENFKNENGNWIEHKGFAQFPALPLYDFERETLTKFNGRKDQRTFNVALEIVTKDKDELAKATNDIDTKAFENEFIAFDKENKVSIWDLEYLAEKMENRAQVLKAAAKRMKICFDYHKHDCANMKTTSKCAPLD